MRLRSSRSNTEEHESARTAEQMWLKEHCAETLQHAVPGRMECPSEYLRALLDKFATQERWTGKYPRGTKDYDTSIGGLFYGVEATKRSCPLCRYNTSQFEAIRCLLLPPLLTLDLALKAYFAREQLIPRDTSLCTGCEKTVNLWEQRSLRLSPKVLLLHLNRFSSDGKGTLGKLSHNIDFKTTIDIKSYMHPDASGATRYKLAAVMVHEGLSKETGHVTAYCRRGQTWHDCDDFYILSATPELTNCTQPYVLAYVREGGPSLPPQGLAKLMVEWWKASLPTGSPTPAPPPRSATPVHRKRARSDAEMEEGEEGGGMGAASDDGRGFARSAQRVQTPRSRSVGRSRLNRKPPAATFQVHL